VALAMALLAGGCGGGGDDEPRANATAIALRGGSQPRLEVLLVRNSPKLPALLGPGEWAFPSGAVPLDNGSDDAAYRSAAARELAGQGGIEVDATQLVAYARWITPAVIGAPDGIDTRFYLAPAPANSRPRPDGSRTVDADWFEPRRALEMHDSGKLPLGYQAIQQLKSLAAFNSAADALGTARGREVEPVELQLVGTGDKRRVVLPDQAP
jgi:8-oxo-dGTP pyrophosphatase MutT (NUDIX family)